MSACGVLSNAGKPLLVTSGGVWPQTMKTSEILDLSNPTPKWKRGVHFYAALQRKQSVEKKSVVYPGLIFVDLLTPGFNGKINQEILVPNRPGKIGL